VRVTVCELPDGADALEAAWAGLCQHTSRHQPELVLLPEFALMEAVWEQQGFDQTRWAAALAESEALGGRLPALRAGSVVGSRAASSDGRRFNEGYHWSDARGMIPLRRKFFLPEQAGNWEASWFDRGDPDFPDFRSGDLSFGLNICTELWALETYGAYAARGVQVILSPRATAAATAPKWLSVGVVAAVRSGAFSLSSNRVDPTGACGGVGWIISPTGQILATTSPEEPFVTIDIDLAAVPAARSGYPCYVFSGPGTDQVSGAGTGGSPPGQEDVLTSETRLPS
jgi:N-carbamoylputrescine amidase